MTAQKEIVIRANCFKLISACFYEPDRDLFIEEQVCTNLQNLLTKWASGAAKEAGEMGLGLRTCTQEQLSVDHAALFVGPFELLAAPYGSIYIEKNRRVMGDSTINVLKFYQDAGLSVDAKEPPDHIAIELEFMHFLCIKEAEAKKSGDEESASRFKNLQCQFFRTNLTWVSQFCDSIKKGTGNPFYSSLADCLNGFMLTCEQVYENKVNATT